MAITKPPVILEPYCGDGTPGTDYIIPPQTGSSSIQTQANGWSSVFEDQLPPDGTGLPVTRQQFNGVHNLYSSHDFWLQAGGYYTFEPTISAKYSGYPIGTVLFNPANGSFCRSQTNNNTANFVSNPALANDGVNWRQITSTSPYVTVVDLAGVNYNVQGNDTLKKFQCDTVGNATLSLNAFTTSYGAGFTVYASDDLVNTMTVLCANSANVITTFLITPGTPTVAITYNGGDWYVNGIFVQQLSSVNLVHGIRKFSNIGSTSFTVPGLVSQVWITACGAGGGGGGGLTSASAQCAGAGGGSGDARIKAQFAVSAGNVITITIPSGGAAGTGGGSPIVGGTGGVTSIGAPINLTLNGGTGGGIGNVTQLSYPGSAGGTFGMRGAMGGTSSVNLTGGNGAGSIFGPGGMGIDKTVATPASNFIYGTGGCGGASATSGSATSGQPGGQGLVIIEW